VLQAVLPLVQALVRASGAGGSAVLADRLASLINKQLGKAHPVFPQPAAAASKGGQGAQGGPEAAAAAARHAAAVQALQGDCKRVLYHASRDKDPRVAAAAAQALLVLLAAGADSGCADAAGAAQACAAAALRDFFEHKKSRLQLAWCQQLLSRAPHAVLGGDGAALTALLAAAAKGRNEATRSKAAQLLPALLCGRPQAQAAALLPVLQQQQGALAAALGAAVAGPYKSKAAHGAAVKAVAQLLGAAVKAGEGKRLAELLGSEAVRELGKCVAVVKVRRGLGGRGGGGGRAPGGSGPADVVCPQRPCTINLRGTGSTPRPRQIPAQITHRRSASTPCRSASTPNSALALRAGAAATWRLLASVCVGQQSHTGMPCVCALLAVGAARVCVHAHTSTAPTSQAAGVPHKVSSQLDHLVKVAGLEQLVAAGKPDPARLALLNKARAAIAGGGAGRAEEAGGADEQQQQQQQQQQQRQQQQGGGKMKKKQEGKDKGKRKNDGQAAAAGDQRHAEAPVVKKQKAQQENAAAGGKGVKRKQREGGAAAAKRKQHKPAA
jgi:hypothetical protein